MEVRPSQSLEEFRAGLLAIGHYFGWEPEEEDAERFSKLLPLDRMIVALDGDSIVAGAGAFPLEMTVPGGVVPTSGVTVVGVLPTHRRRGILTQMMRRQTDDALARGEHAGALWASESTIYGRYGYGIASSSARIDLPKHRAALAVRGEARGTFTVVTPDRALDTFPAIYDQVRLRTPGMMSRTREWWELRRLRNPPGEKPLSLILLELDGAPAGYAMYRVTQEFDGGGTSGHVRVIEAMGTTPEATREVWRYILEFDWTASIRAALLPVDHELLFLLAEPRSLMLTVLDGLMVRVLDVQEALGARGYAADGKLVFEVADAFVPNNAGRWKLDGGQAERTDDEPDLRLDVTALGSTYLGGVTFTQLVRACRIEELREGAAAQADAMFHADRAPWCPEIF